jgi:hypothetical protein
MAATCVRTLLHYSAALRQCHPGLVCLGCHTTGLTGPIVLCTLHVRDSVCSSRLRAGLTHDVKQQPVYVT